MDQRVITISICAAIGAVLLCFGFGRCAGLWTSASWSPAIFGSDAVLAIIGNVSAERPWDIFYHLGGNGPWIPKVDNIVGNGTEPPEGCWVDQVHMISRHAERYPTVNAGIKMLALYQRIQDANVTLKGDLAFVNDWEFFTGEPGKTFENLVSTGPYAGTLEAFTSGVKLRTRYQHLLEAALARGATSFWASDSARVIDTARYFADGFFGIDWRRLASLHVIPETPNRAADTLTPGRTCLKFRNNADEYGHDYGYRMMDAFRSTYEPAIVERLAKQNPALPFTEDEIFSMQLMCGFETLVKGNSPWCNVFTEQEWGSFEYARDVIHYYRAGPGNPYSGSMGWLWLNATSNLLLRGSEAGPLFFSLWVLSAPIANPSTDKVPSVHDGDIVPFLHALDLLPQSPDLPTTHVLQNRTWRTSDIVPMGGRIIFERLICAAPKNCWSNAPFYPNHVYCDPQTYDTFVRVNVNDGIMALPRCDSGPGKSCPLDDFVSRVRQRGEEFEEFGKICGLDEAAAKRITFLHQ